MNLLKKSGVLVLLCLFISCSNQMDEKAIKEYFSKSQAVTLFSPGFSDKKLSGCEEDYLGQEAGLFKDSEPTYYYKTYNYKVDRIEDYKVEGDQIFCVLCLLPDNLTKAGKILYDVPKDNPYKAQLKTGLNCDIIFKKVDGKWVLVHFKSKKYIRGFWLEKYQEESGYTDLLQWDK